MHKLFLLLIFLISFLLVSLPEKGFAQSTVFSFTFEGTEAVTVDNAVGTPAFSIIGTLTTPDYFGGVAANCTTTTGSARSHAGWGTGEAYRFTVNTMNYAGLAFQVCMRSSNTQVGTFIIRASADGNTWTTIQSSFTPGGTFLSYGGALPASCENKSAIYIEVYKTNNAGNAGNNVRIDNALLTSSVLPVELTAFDAVLKNGEAHLSWRTATELTNDYFQIERSATGRDFEAIGRVEGAGTRYIPTDYVFMDEAPLPGWNYYRLRQVDEDGQFDWSPVRAVFSDTRGDRPERVAFFPNPAREYIRCSRPTQPGDQFEVFDHLGRQVLQGSMLESDAPLNVAALSAGTYVVRLKTAAGVASGVFVRLK